jgi:hypothetical protein
MRGMPVQASQPEALSGKSKSDNEGMAFQRKSIDEQSVLYKHDCSSLQSEEGGQAMKTENDIFGAARFSKAYFRQEPRN